MINIAFSGNIKVFDGVLITTLSILKTTKESLHIYLLTGDFSHIDERFMPLTEKERKFIEELCQKYNPDSLVTLLDMTKYALDDKEGSKNLNSSYTPYTLLRIYLDLVPELPSKIIYLDIDIIVMKDLKELDEIDVTNTEFAGVKDYLGRVFINRHYINAGVLILNLKEIKKTGLFVKCRHLLSVKKYAFPDQDAINHMAMEKMFLPRKFNDQRIIHEDTVIRHYCKSIRWLPFFHTINVKPWNIDMFHKKHKVFVHDELLNEYVELKDAYLKGSN